MCCKGFSAHLPICVPRNKRADSPSLALWEHRPPEAFALFPAKISGSTCGKRVVKALEALSMPFWWSSLQGDRGCGSEHCKHLSARPQCSKITLDQSPRAWKKSFKEKMVRFSFLFLFLRDQWISCNYFKIISTFPSTLWKHDGTHQGKKKEKMEALNGWEASKKRRSVMRLIPDYTIVLFWATREDHGKKSRIKRRLLSNDSFVKILAMSIKVCCECFR